MARALAVACLLIGCGPKRPVPSEPSALSVAVPLTADEVFATDHLLAMRDELTPLIERHAGRRFTTPPVVEVFDPAAFAEFAARETRLMIDAVYRDTPEHVREAQVAEQNEIRGLYGKYGLFEKKTYVVPETLQQSSAQLGVPLEDLTRVVLAHELVHALQDQVAESQATLGTLVDLDHFRAWSAVSEGGANAVTRKVARDAGIEDAFWGLSRSQGWGPDGLEEHSAYPLWINYGLGMETMARVLDAGGPERFWEWHVAPPAASSMIFRPDGYASTVPEPTAALVEALRGTEQALTRGPWMVSNTRLGEYELRGDAIRTGKVAEFEAVLTHLVDARHLDLAMADRSGDIRILRFDEPAAARQYLSLLRAEQTIEGQNLARAYGAPVEVTYGELEGIDVDASLIRLQRVAASSGNATETRTAWALRGADVVAVEAVRFRPGLRLARTIEAVLNQLTD